MYKRLLVLPLALVLMGCPLFEKDKKDDPEPVDASFDVTPISTTLTLPFDGCLTADEVLTTSEGVELTLLAGTCLKTAFGERLTGSVTVALGPPAAEDIPEFESLSGRSFDGLVAINVGLEMPGGAPAVPIDAVFDPPGILDMEAVLDHEGTWNLEAFGADITTYAYPTMTAVRPPGEPPADKVWTSDHIYEVTDSGYEQTTTFVPYSSVTGADLSDPDIPADGEEVEGDVIFEEPLGSTDDEWPKLGGLRIVNADTAIIMSVNTWIPGLFLPGQRRIVDGVGYEDAFEVRIIERDGQRIMQIVSPLKNRFKIQICLRHENTEPTYVRRDSTGYSDLEEDDGPYIGRIYVIITGCFDPLELEEDILPILEAADPNFVLSQNGSYQQEGNRSETSGSSDHYTGNSSSYATNIANNAPPGWTFQYGNRIVTIDVPWPPAEVVLTDFGASLLHELDPNTFAIADTLGPIAVQPNDVIVNRDGLAVVAGTDTLEFIDLTANQGLATVPIPGLISAIEPGPFGDVFFVAHGNGELLAIDYDTTLPVFTVPLPPGEDYTSISIAADGAFAYVTSPTLGEVLEVDLLRRMPTFNMPVPNVESAAVSRDGRTLAAVDPTGGAVTLFELGTTIPPLGVPTGMGAIKAFWPLLDDGVIVANDGQGSVTFVDRNDGTVVQVPTAQGAQSIAEVHDGVAQSTILVGNFQANSLSLLPYTNISTLPVVTTNAGFNQANAIRTTGR